MSVNHDWLAAVAMRLGIAAFGLEHHGHGKSGGLKGFVPSFDNCVTDVLNWAAIIKDKYLPPGAPLFIYGESMGGGIALHAAIREPHCAAGLVLFAPMTGLPPTIAPSALITTIGRAAAWLSPTFELPRRDLPKGLFRDESIYARAASDPHRYQGGMRLGTAMQLHGAMESLLPLCGGLTTPFLLLHGTGDPITSHEASERVFLASPSTDKTLLHYEGACHILWTEPLDTRERIFRDVFGWVLPRANAEWYEVDRTAAPIAVHETRPLGTLAFHAPGHALTLYSIDTHGHLYTATSPAAGGEPLAPPARLDIHKRTHEKHHLHAARTAAHAAAGGGGSASTGVSGRDEASTVVLTTSSTDAGFPSQASSAVAGCG